MVITSALHAEGRGFDPRPEYILFSQVFVHGLNFGFDLFNDVGFLNFAMLPHTNAMEDFSQYFRF